MTLNWLDKIEEVIKPVIEREGCILYDIEFVGAGKGRALRVYIDKESESISINDCSRVSNGINLILDVEDVIPGGGYSLEVSTPGLDRRLKKPWHYQKVVGQKVLVKTNRSLESVGVSSPKWKAAKTIEKELMAANDEGIQFDFDGQVVQIPYDLIEKAKLTFEITKGIKK